MNPAGHTCDAVVQFAVLPEEPVHGSPAPLYGGGIGRFGVTPEVFTGVTGLLTPVPVFTVF